MIPELSCESRVAAVVVKLVFGTASVLACCGGNEDGDAALVALRF